MDVKPETGIDPGSENASAANCPPLAQWPVIANMRVWSSRPSDDLWKRIRKCPHCGTLREELEREAD